MREVKNVMGRSEVGEHGVKGSEVGVSGVEGSEVKNVVKRSEVGEHGVKGSWTKGSEGEESASQACPDHHEPPHPCQRDEAGSFIKVARERAALKISLRVPASSRSDGNCVGRDAQAELSRHPTPRCIPDGAHRHSATLRSGVREEAREPPPATSAKASAGARRTGGDGLFQRGRGSGVWRKYPIQGLLQSPG